MTEMFAGNLYMAKLIIGFSYIHDIRETFDEGMEAALTYEVAIVNPFWDHCKAIATGDTL